MCQVQRTRLLLLPLLFLLFAAGVHAQTSTEEPSATPLRYELRFDRPSSHLLDITIQATDLRGPAVEFAMPAWAPGSYRINDYAKMVEQFRAETPDGKLLEWRKTDKQTWRIELGGAREATVRYKLYGNTLQNNWVQYNDKHAFIAGPAAWMYQVGGKQRPIALTIDVPAGWKVATGMPRTGPNTFAAQDYDWFADSPLEISDYAEQTFTNAGTTYHVTVHDIGGARDFSQATRDMQKIAETIVAGFDPAEPNGRAAPFADYWFLFHIWPRTGGGLEHLNSTQINFSTPWDGKGNAGRYGSDYQLKLFVISHEFYHAWNVKRLRPLPLGPFDYSREVHTPSLWISEGLTSYYGQLALVRAGLVTPEEYLQSISGLISDLEDKPGRRERSIADTSWDTWFQATPPGETNMPNTDHSYYDSGQVMGHLLDFAIRHYTGNRKSLDDWMRLLYQRHALPLPGFTPEDAVRAASEVAGRDMSDFFRRFIRGKEIPDYDAYFAYAGIEVQKLMQDSGWLGVTFGRSARGEAEIQNVLPGGPAMVAGLDRDDVITELDGKAIRLDTLLESLGKTKPGDVVRLKVRRMGETRNVQVTLGADPSVIYVLRPMSNPSELQKQIYQSWLGIH